MVHVAAALGASIGAAEMRFTLPVDIVFPISSGDANPSLRTSVLARCFEKQQIAYAAWFKNACNQCGMGRIFDSALSGVARNVRCVKNVAAKAPANLIVCPGWCT
jgi:hypothetical protein